MQWARVQAQTLNLQANTEGVPFLPSDFMGGDREQRVAAAQAEREVAEMQAAVENMQLLMMRSGDKAMDETGVPAWALGKRKRG
jgi:hypothetical protein